MLKIAVLLATYNGEKYISEQLNSLISQSYKDFTCYIHDDGSKDQTVKICEEFEKKYPDLFKILHYDTTGGAKNNFLSLLEKVDADYYMFCDQDDVWLPNKIEKMVESTCDIKQDFLAFSDLKIVDEKLNILSESFYRESHVVVDNINYKNAMIKGFIPGCTMMFNHELAKKAMKFEDSNNIKMHDWWMVLVALNTDSRMVYIDCPLGLYRQHAENTIGAKNQSTADRVRFNIKRILNGTLATEKKRNITSPRIQAKELYNTGFGSKEKRDFVLKYVNIGDKNKLSRTLFYLKNFQNVYRMWWMLLWV